MQRTAPALPMSAEKWSRDLSCRELTRPIRQGRPWRGK